MVFEIEKRREERNPTGHELKSFESFRARGILLYRQNYQENDLIVDLLLENELRLSALVRGGQRSLKRFGGKLEPLKLLSLQLRAPKGVVTYDKLFSLEAADVIESFDEFKKSWNSLNEGFFYTEFFRDLSTKGEIEPWFYEAAVKVLVAGNHLASESNDWRRLYVWCYFSKQAGYGVLGDKGLFTTLMGDELLDWEKLFAEELFSEPVLTFLQNKNGRVLEKKVIRDLYSDWMQRSHLKCKSIESWAMV